MAEWVEKGSIKGPPGEIPDVSNFIQKEDVSSEISGISEKVASDAAVKNYVDAQVASEASSRQREDESLKGQIDAKANTVHTHEVADVTGLSDKLAEIDNKAQLDHVHDDATDSASGFMSAADKKKLDGIDTTGYVKVLREYSGSIQDEKGYIDTLMITNDPMSGMNFVQIRTDGEQPTIAMDTMEIHGFTDTVSDSADGYMLATDKAVKDYVQKKTVTVDSELSDSSVNPVQNKVIKTALDGKSAVGHNHDEMYYTESEIDSKLEAKADSSHTHDDATTVASGFMSASDKTKLDGVATNANNYVLPNAGEDFGGVKTGGDVTITDGIINVNDDSHNHVIDNVDGLQGALDAKSDSGHNHDDRYYTETEMDAKLGGKAEATHTHEYDSSLSGESVNAVQNKVVNEALAGKVPVTRTINGKPLSNNVTLAASDVGADADGSADSALSEAKSYTDTKISALVNSAPDTLDTLGELATAMTENQDAIESLNAIASSKADASALTSHTGNSTIHITSQERSGWNAAKTHASSAHAPSNAEENQNAFSNVKVGDQTIAADTKTDTLTIVSGSNVTVTPNVEGDTITIAAKDTTYSNATGSASGLMSSADKTKLDGIASGATKTVVDASLSSSSTNPVQNKAVKSALDGKANTSHTHTISQVTDLQSTLNGKAAASHTHTADNITSGTLSNDRLSVVSIAKGGTGASSATQALANLGISFASDADFKAYFGIS